MEKINIEVVYALPERQCVMKIMIVPGANIKEAILSSKILDLFPDINLDAQEVGVFGQIKPMTYQPVANDRIEIYRPLAMDPMTARRLKANKT